MNEKYRRLSAADRKVICNMKQSGRSQELIGRAVGFSQSTISKELSRNRGARGYRDVQAAGFAKERQRAKKPRARALTGETKDLVEERLRAKHSPDQISGKLELGGVSVSHEAIYKHVSWDKKNGGELWRELRINGKRRYRRCIKAGRGEQIPDRTDIGERPAEVAERERYGDWEADLIQGGSGSGYLLSLYERKSRLGKLFKLKSKGSEETAIRIITILRGLAVTTITYDNGLEFARHGFVNKLLECKSYFCKPYCSWEKGGVENYNRLVRQYFPKGMDFGGITEERLTEVEQEINNRPRNLLGYESPNDLLELLRAS